MKKWVLAIICGLGSISLIAQTNMRRSMGEIDDPESVSKTPVKIQLSDRSYRGMPSSSSLEQWCPTPGDQSNYGTCAAWATGYGIATLLYAKTHNITSQSEIDRLAFSPSYLYEQVKSSTDTDCQGGASTINAILTLIELGDVKMNDVPYSCNPSINADHMLDAFNYRLGDASILYAAKGFSKDDALYRDDETIIDLTKKAILDGTPIAISYMLPESFFDVKTSVWNPDHSESLKDWKHNSHAMCVIGYDDNVSGGAFRILNSWGTSWGDKGKIWIKYSDFPKYIKMGFQVFGNPESKPPKTKDTPSPQPSPTPAPAPKPSPIASNGISGSMEFRLSNGDEMSVGKTSTRNLVVEDEESYTEDLVAYTMNQSYPSGTRFRFYLNTDKEVYIYALATDLSGKINRILPYDDLISTHIGANSTIAFPSDTKIIKLDENKGTDYLLVLYSTTKLDINDLISKMNQQQGGLSLKISKALGSKLIPKDQVQYDSGKVAFQIKDLSTQSGTVIPVMIEIKHH